MRLGAAKRYALCPTGSERYGTPQTHESPFDMRKAEAVAEYLE